MECHQQHSRLQVPNTRLLKTLKTRAGRGNTKVDYLGSALSGTLFMYLRDLPLIVACGYFAFNLIPLVTLARNNNATARKKCVSAPVGSFARESFTPSSPSASRAPSDAQERK
jgi:hypothetical protein